MTLTILACALVYLAIGFGVATVWWRYDKSTPAEVLAIFFWVWPLAVATFLFVYPGFAARGVAKWIKENEGEEE